MSIASEIVDQVAAYQATHGDKLPNRIVITDREWGELTANIHLYPKTDRFSGLRFTGLNVDVLPDQSYPWGSFPE